jgi:type IV pilus assembly protein PilM
MADTGTVWGIDIGQAGLKAIQLRYNDASQQVVAVGFDYIQHPKILSQPDAIPAELINEAIKTFVSRNSAQLKGSLIGFSVPSNTSIVKFIQLPPVESSKVADIVKYEARQQIPFDLNDVVWDWQTMGGGVQEGGYMLDSEVGLVAMKKEALQGHMKPFLDHKIELDTIQSTPLAMFNFLAYDQFGQRPGDSSLERDAYTVLLDMGADTTTMLVSNGRKIWQRNISIGGNQFTRALTKEMKLTFAKAEHLKCNATKAPDPKAVFQALRPVFNDYVSEIQRSIGFFSSVNRDAKIEKILAVGNGFKLAGLQKFLQQNLQYEVERVEMFPGLVGDAVLDQPLFQENAMSFAVAYGIGLQMLAQTSIKTSLLPPEIKTARLIRMKKPWALVTAATLMAGLSISTMAFSAVRSTVAEARWKTSEDEVTKVQGISSSLKTAYDSAVKKNKDARDAGEALVKPAVGRTMWLEVYKAINACLPIEGDTKDEKDITKKNRLRVYSITCREVADLKTWFDEVKVSDPNAVVDYFDAEDKEKPPTGTGYVFTLRGLHYSAASDLVFKTLMHNLQQWEVEVPGSILIPESHKVPVRKMGITHVMSLRSKSTTVKYYPNGQPANMMTGAPNKKAGFAGFGGAGPMGPGMGRPTGGHSGPSGATKMMMPAGPMGVGGTGRVRPPVNDEMHKSEDVRQTDFELMFVWQPILESARLPARPVSATPAANGTTPATGTPATGTPAIGAPATTAPGHANGPTTSPMQVPMPNGTGAPTPMPAVSPMVVPMPNGTGPGVPMPTTTVSPMGVPMPMPAGTAPTQPGSVQQPGAVQPIQGGQGTGPVPTMP